MKNVDEIKKALECCRGNGKCNECPYEDKDCYFEQDALDLINYQEEEYNHLLKIAKKMHLWIFLNCGDEAKVYEECGLTDEDNALLGYSGEFMLGTSEDKE